MLRPQTYTLGKCLHKSADFEVYAGVQDRGATEVLLKRYPATGRGDTGSRAQRELDLLRAAQGPGLPRVLEWISDAQPPVLVLERPPGVPLESCVRLMPLAPDTFVAMAIELTEALGRIHQTGWIHCGVSPANIWIDRSTGRTTLVDCGSARMLGAADVRTGSSRGELELASVLAYIAPEQTGRMARGIDFRSDLYALGATFYFALTGTQPFESDDALALVHAHMARMPVAPIERRPDLPATLSRIAIKLLQKEPDDRYQTAQALRRDLIACREQLLRTGGVADDLPLGTGDVPQRPLFSARLHGRESELGALRAAYERSSRGGVEFVLLSGPAGVGKSALVHDLRATLGANGGYLAQGKFDLYRRDVPYAGLTSALDSWTQQILSESEARLAHWRAILGEALGKLAAVVIELVPDLKIVLPDASGVPRLGPRETRARLVYALERLMLGGARPEHPLVLFLDDLQWADPGSIAVLEALLGAASEACLLIVATCRDDDEAARSPTAALVAELARMSVRVTQISVPPLGLEAVAEMLADALGAPVERMHGLATCIAAKTGSNPLWIQQFVAHMHASGLIRYDPEGGWLWDEQEIARQPIPEGAVALMVAKLERLAPRPRTVLRFASCVADEFAVDLLAELTGEPRTALEGPLFELAKEGLIAPSPSGFRFVHDRIREAAHALLSEDERSRLHHRTALHLLECAPLAEFTERVFELADHLNRGIDHLGEDLRIRALGINVAAGARALAVGAAQTASAYLAVANRLLREEDWETSEDLAFNLHMQCAEVSYQTLDVERALEILDALEARPLPRVHQAGVAAKRIMCFNVARPREVGALTLKELRRFGLRLPQKASHLRAWLELLYTDWLFRGSPLDASAFGRRPTDDPAWAAPLMIFSAGGASLTRDAGLPMLCIVTCQSLRRLRLYGAPPGIPQAIAVFAAQRSAFGFDAAGTERFAQAALDWTERVPSPLDIRARFILHCFTLSYLRPRRTLLEPLLRLAESAREAGDSEYAVYISAHRWIQLALCGEPLAALVEESERLIDSFQTEFVKEVYRALRAPYALLQDPLAAVRDWTRDPPEMTRALEAEHEGEGFVTLHWFMVLCYLGQYARAAALLHRLTPKSFTINPSSFDDFVMTRAVCAAANSEHEGRWRRLRVAHELRRALLLTRIRKGSSPDFVHMRIVVRAELARLRGRPSQALALYDEAFRRARECGYRHHAALIQERRSSLLGANRRAVESRAALEQAAELYAQWGAVGKVRALERVGIRAVS